MSDSDSGAISRDWDSTYASDSAPWDIGRPQPVFVRLADAGEFRLITRRINGGENGLAQREAYYRKAKQVLATSFPAAARRASSDRSTDGCP